METFKVSIRNRSILGLKLRPRDFEGERVGNDSKLLLVSYKAGTSAPIHTYTLLLQAYHYFFASAAARRLPVVTTCVKISGQGVAEAMQHVVNFGWPSTSTVGAGAVVSVISSVNTNLITCLSLAWVSFGSRIGRDQNKTEKDPNETVETAIRPKRDSFETQMRPICD
jgi:hypothetical protein